MPTFLDDISAIDQPLSYFGRQAPDWSDERGYAEVDVTEHRSRMESSRSHLDLCARELSRLAEISAQGMLETQRAAQTKGDLLATMSHELRTPLNGILGMTGLLLSRNLDATERDYVEIIKQSGETLMALIDDVLDFSKIEANRLEIETTELNPRQAVQEAIRIVQVSADKKELSLITEIDDGVPAVIEGDRLRLRQVLLNLLSNAIKFTAAGSITIRVSRSVDSAGHNALRFTVTDGGIGISPEGQARLFQPFSQADPSISRRFGGTGLGLAICKRLVELMGGSIGVQSELDAGSSFWFTLRAKAMGANVSVLPCCHRQSEVAPLEMGPKILLADDNAINRRVAALTLKDLGYAVTTVKDGEDAVQAVNAGFYDLVLMDCQMPGMDGFAATQAIRQNGSQIPIIAMTANASARDREACLLSGMNDFLAKPMSEGALQATIERWLRVDDLHAEAAIA